MLCSEAVLINQDGTGGHAATLRCRRWSCDICNPFNHRNVKRRAREGAPSTFLTLTVRPSRYETPDEAARDLKRAWVNLRRSLTRRNGDKAPPFIAVFEQTKKGWPHLHILCRMRFVDQRIISAFMGRAIDAPIVDIRHVTDVGRIGAYIAKYISKAPAAFKGCKRWWRSHDYPIEPDDLPKFGIYSDRSYRINTTLPRLIGALLAAGCTGDERSATYYRWLGPFDFRAASLGAMQSGP